MLLTEFHLLHFFFSSWFLLFLSNYKWWDWFCKVNSSHFLYFFLFIWILLYPFPCHLATTHANCKGYLLYSIHISLAISDIWLVKFLFNQRVCNLQVTKGPFGWIKMENIFLGTRENIFHWSHFPEKSLLSP